MRRAILVGLVAIALGGCASSSFSMRGLPPETPAADNAAAVKNVEAMIAAASASRNAAAPADAATSGDASSAQSAPGPGNSPANQPNTGVSNSAPAREVNSADNANPKPAAAAPPHASGAADSQTLVPLTTADAPSMYTYDPFERVNRFTYRFNARFDEAVFLPVSNGYRRVPAPIRYGVHNFFANLSEVDSVVNYSLQLRLLGGVRSLGRFVINSTLGIGGLFDVATRLKLPNPPTGFSATLSTWGMHPGPYLVMPLLGPSTLRDGVGYLGDFGISYGVNVASLYRGNKTYALGTVNAIDQRSNTSFRYYATGSPFEYETIRFLYVRKTLIEDEALHGKGRPKARDVTAPAGR